MRLPNVLQPLSHRDSVSRACHERSTRSIDTCVIVHTRQKCSFMLWDTYILFIRSFPLSHFLSRSFICTDAHVSLPHTHIITMTVSDLIGAPAIFRDGRNVPVKQLPTVERIVTLLDDNRRAIHASIRGRLPRLFKFPLTVRSAHRRIPAATHTAPRNTSLLLTQKRINLFACTRCLFEPRHDVTD